MYLGHPKVSFYKVVVEGYVEVIHEGQYLFSVFIEAFEEISGLALFPPPPFFWWILSWAEDSRGTLRQGCFGTVVQTSGSVL